MSNQNPKKSMKLATSMHQYPEVNNLSFIISSFIISCVLTMCGYRDTETRRFFVFLAVLPTKNSVSPCLCVLLCISNYQFADSNSFRKRMSFSENMRKSFT